MDAKQGSRKAILLVALVFALGIALGGVGTYLMTSRVHAAVPQVAHTPANAVAILTHDVNLTGDQQKQIETILTETQARYAEIHRQADPEYEQARQQSKERIRQILTAEQKPKFEQVLRRLDEERRVRKSEGR